LKVGDKAGQMQQLGSAYIFNLSCPASTRESLREHTIEGKKKYAMLL
jgi:hypothetical protein